MISERIDRLRRTLQRHTDRGVQLSPASVCVYCAVLADIAGQARQIERLAVPPAARHDPAAAVSQAAGVVSLDAARRRRRGAPVVGTPGGGAPDPGGAA